MTTETEYIDLPTLQDVAKAHAEGWEIEFANSSSQIFSTWSGLAWHADRQFRGRPRQPKMKEVKMECFVIDRRIGVAQRKLSVLSLWIRQPHLDLIAKVPE